MPTEPPTEPRTATTINLAVARAAGIKCEKYDGDAGDDYVLRAMVDDPLSLKDWAIWNPTGDMNDAMEAAEAVGLFDFKDEVASCLWKTRHGKWAMNDAPFADTPECAICEAIEAQERKEDR